MCFSMALLSLVRVSVAEVFGGVFTSSSPQKQQSLHWSDPGNSRIHLHRDQNHCTLMALSEAEVPPFHPSPHVCKLRHKLLMSHLPLDPAPCKQQGKLRYNSDSQHLFHIRVSWGALKIPKPRPHPQPNTQFVQVEHGYLYFMKAPGDSMCRQV